MDSKSWWTLILKCLSLGYGAVTNSREVRTSIIPQGPCCWMRQKDRHEGLRDHLTLRPHRASRSFTSTTLKATAYVHDPHPVLVSPPDGENTLCLRESLKCQSDPSPYRIHFKLLCEKRKKKVIAWDKITFSNMESIAKLPALPDVSLLQRCYLCNKGLLFLCGWKVGAVIPGV